MLSNGGGLHRINSDTGKIEESTPLPAAGWGAIGFDGRHVVACEGETLRWLDPETGKIVRAERLNYPVCSVNATGGVLTLMEQPTWGYDTHHQRILISPKKAAIHRVLMAPSVAQPSIEWAENLESALEQSNADGRPVIHYFRGASENIEKSLFFDPEVVDFSRKLIWVKHPTERFGPDHRKPFVTLGPEAENVYHDISELSEKQRKATISKLQARVAGLQEEGESKTEIPPAIADAVAECCPHCSHDKLMKWGQASGLHRWKCNDCRITFNILTKTPLARLRKKEK